jgi:proline iminopeptidase
MMKKLLIILGGVLAVGCIGAGLLGWWAYRVMTGPIYEPGALAAMETLEPPAQSGSADRWNVEPEIELGHFARGEGPPILFVHGGPGFPLREPLPWLDGLAESYQVHFYDQRGCGESTRPFDRFASPSFYPNMTKLESTLGLGAQIADIERIRRLLGQDRLTLMGHSFGGFLAALYAAEFPDRVDKLILLAPADMLVMPHDGQDLLSLVRDRLPADERTAYDDFLGTYFDFGSLFEQDEASLARRNLELGNFILKAMDRPPLPTPDAGETIDAGGWMVFAMYLSMGKRHDYRDAMSRVTAPTLVVHGDRDLAPIHASEQYARLIRGAELVRVSGADHFFDDEQAELTRRVVAFLRAEPGGQP